MEREEEKEGEREQKRGSERGKEREREEGMWGTETGRGREREGKREGDERNQGREEGRGGREREREKGREVEGRRKTHTQRQTIKPSREKQWWGKKGKKRQHRDNFWISGSNHVLLGATWPEIFLFYFRVWRYFFNNPLIFIFSFCLFFPKLIWVISKVRLLL